MPDRPETCAAPRPVSTASAPELHVPELACDCHAHIFPVGETGSLDPARSYTPASAPEGDYAELMARLGLGRSVIVQPSVYGTDNRVTIDAVARDPANRRAVVVVTSETGASALQALRRDGATGARVNLLFESGHARPDPTRLGHALTEAGMHLQLLVDAVDFDVAGDVLARTPKDLAVVLDHFGHVSLASHRSELVADRLRLLLDTDRVWIKLSGAYRITAERAPPYRDVAPLARMLVAHRPDRLIWGTDWPHPAIDVEMPDDGSLLNALGDWCPDDDARRRILVDNPARLYRFERDAA